MLLRALIDVSKPALRLRVERALEALEVAALLSSHEDLLARVEQVGADLVVLDEERLGRDSELQQLRGTASRPEVVLLAGKGVLLDELPAAVSRIDAGASDGELSSALSLAVARRAALVAPRVRPELTATNDGRRDPQGALAPPWETRNPDPSFRFETPRRPGAQADRGHEVTSRYPAPAPPWRSRPCGEKDR